MSDEERSDTSTETSETSWLEPNRTRFDYRPSNRSYGYTGYEAERFQETEIGKSFDWQPIFTTILLGARDAHSPFSFLRGKEHDIIRHVCGFLVYKYKAGAVEITPPAYAAARVTDDYDYSDSEEERSDDGEDEGELEVVLSQDEGDIPVMNVLIPFQYQIERLGKYKHDRPHIAFSPCGQVEFPEPNDINVNMMPFVMGDRKTLPKELRPYYDTIISKCPVAEDEKGDIMYLTIQESFVQADKTQRRPGLHIEAPSASASHFRSGQFVAGLEHHWGLGMAYSPDEFEGGIYVASNISNTTAVWDALIDPKFGAVDTHGGIEHLRPYIGKGKKLPASLLVWMTDHTPHEGLPQEEDGYRQFFRLVTSNISVWFAAQSTPNPKVPVPSHVRVIDESKFSAHSQGASRIYTDDDFADDVA